MAGITLTQAEAKLTAVLDMMDRGVLEAEMDGQRLHYHKMSDLQNAVDYWDAKVKELTNDPDGGITPKQITPETDV